MHSHPAPASRADVRRTIKRHVLLLLLTLAVVVVPNIMRLAAEAAEW